MVMVTHPPGQALSAFAKLGYHDPVYDEGGGQGTAVVPIDDSLQGNPGALLIVALIVLVVMLMGDD